MAGLYIHIPFCRQACRYCDFFFTISLGYKEEMIKAIIKELRQRSDNSSYSTIYFGGGTPSVLEVQDIEKILQAIYLSYKITNPVEITFEANPDDLTPEYLKSLVSLGINRLSIGIQSFYEDDLKLLRRIHTAEQGIRAIDRAFEAGLGNINADLIYGLSSMNEMRLKANLKILTDLSVPHISAYHITYEPGTVLDHWRKKGRIKIPEEEESVRQFSILRSYMTDSGFDHYEISNFALSGYISVHNSNYWKQVPYIGTGPSAHSYTGTTRRWNYSSVKKYLENINQGTRYFDEEELGVDDMYNEFIMTSLRTKWGININELKYKFGDDRLAYLAKKTYRYLKDELLKKEDSSYILTERGMLLSDYIITDLFI